MDEAVGCGLDEDGIVSLWIGLDRMGWGGVKGSGLTMSAAMMWL